MNDNRVKRVLGKRNQVATAASRGLPGGRTALASPAAEPPPAGGRVRLGETAEQTGHLRAAGEPSAGRPPTAAPGPRRLLACTARRRPHPLHSDV